MRTDKRVQHILVWILLASTYSLAGGQDIEAQSTQIEGMSEADHRNLEMNLRWMLQRSAKPDSRAATVAVFADAGVWHIGARSIVDALERDDIGCQVIDRTQLKTELLQRYKALVLPGGWAPFQRDAAQSAGLAAIRRYVEQGGRCLAICAGAYLISREVKYEGEIFPYPLGLFDGTSEGPIDGLARFPNSGPVTLKATAAGIHRGVGCLDDQPIYYSGGPRFVGGNDIEILATYPDRTPALISRRIQSGEIILLGAHCERPTPDSTPATTPPPTLASKILRALLLPSQ